jgi:ABC-type Zn uptake system ZnuABC Zn-binding protein ZnuA
LIHKASSSERQLDGSSYRPGRPNMNRSSQTAQAHGKPDHAPRRSPIAVAALGVLVLVLVVACGGTAGFGSVGGVASDAPPGDRTPGWSDELTGAPDRLDVATTVAPISSIARNIGGTRIRLHGIVPDATNSHTFEPSPSDARTLAAADLIVVNGLHLEEPTLGLAEASKRADAPILSLGEETVAPDEWIFDFSFPASEGDPNPHLWMDPLHAARYAELMRDAFSEADPANAEYYAANEARFEERIDAYDAAIRTAVGTVPQADRRLLTYHDSWAYWARRYGFRVIGAVQASDFSDPSPQDVAALIEQIRRERVPAVFGSEVFPSPVLEQIARESGATFVDELRDDEPPGGPDAAEHTYLGMLKKDMQIMLTALGGSSAAIDPLPVEDGYLP